MKNSTNLNRDKEVIYSTQETCPICGEYQYDGNVCSQCKKEHDLYRPKRTYVDGVC